MARPLPSVSGRFVLLRRLGSGSFSEVFLAEDREPRGGPRRVALKLFRSPAEGGSATSLSSLEFQYLARLRHPNLASVYDYGVDRARERPFYTMELLRGRDFLSATRRLHSAKLIPLVVEVCRALHHIHVRGIVHHDLKPGNLIVLRRRAARSPAAALSVKLTDFGLSRPLAGGDDGRLRGTPEFMAPELLSGEGSDHRCDLYSLGVLLYLCLSGRYPFPPSLDPQTRGIPPPPLRARGGGRVATVLEDVVATLLRVDPRQRYASANEVIHDLGLYTGFRFPPEPGTVGGGAGEAEGMPTLAPRQAEALRQAISSLGGKRLPAARVIFLLGPPGSGKTHLLRQVRRLAQTSGAGFLTLAPPEQGGEASSPSAWARAILEEAERLREGHGRGLVLAGDARGEEVEAASRLLHGFLGRGETGGTLLLLAADPREPAIDRLLSKYPDRGPVGHLFLRPLDGPGAAGMLSQLLGTMVSPGDPLTACILEESGGIPLLVEGSLEHLRSSHALEPGLDGAVFDLSRHRLDFTPTPAHLLPLYQDAAAEAATPVLETLSIFTEPAEAAAVAEILRAGGGEQQVLAELQRAAIAGILCRETGSSGRPAFRFRSCLLRNLVHRRLPPPAGRRLHRAAARLIAGRAGACPPGEPPLALWLHLLLAGDPERAWEEGLRRASWLEAKRRPGEAVHLLRRLLAGPGASRVSSGPAAHLRERLADLERASGRWEEALGLLDEALRQAQKSGDDAASARIHLALGRIEVENGELERAESHFQQALRDVPAVEGGLRGDILLQSGFLCLRAGRLPEADRFLRLAQEACQKAEYAAGMDGCRLLKAKALYRRQELGPAAEQLACWLADRPEGEATADEGRARILLGSIRYQQNRFAEAAEQLQRAWTILRDLGERNLEALALGNLGAMHYESGHYARAGHFNLECLRVHEEMGNRYAQALCRYNLGVCHYHRARYLEAREYLLTATRIYEALDDRQWLASCHNQLAELHLALGDPGEARRILALSASALEGSEPGLAEGDRALLEGELARETGEFEQGAELSGRAAGIFARLRDERQAVRARLLLCRCRAAAGARQEARGLLAGADKAARGISSPRLQAEVLLAGSALRLEHGWGPTDARCAAGLRQALRQLADIEDPDLRILLLAALARHLEAGGEAEDALAAWREAYILLREVASQFAAEEAAWKSGYLSRPPRDLVVGRVAEWMKKKALEGSRRVGGKPIQ